MLAKLLKTFCALGLGLVLAACGPKQGMEGANHNSTEEGQVTDSEEATGAGDTTSFGEDVEKVDEYTVVRGDNLWNIAAKPQVYRSGWLYPLILKANRSKISDAGQLKIGITLRIPRGLSSADMEIAREEAMAGTYEGSLPPVSMGAAALAPTPLAKPGDRKPAPGGTGGGSLAIWLGLLALAGGGAFWFFKMRKRAEESATAS